MADGEVIAYSTAAFICALFRARTLVALLTAGAEWEELAVVVISIARHRSSLAVGNIVGSAISNILGAFSLGLLFHAKGREVVFDRSAKLYSLLLLVVTGLAAGLLGFARHVMWRVLGSVMIGVFAVYVLSVSLAIRKGVVAAPELSDSDESDASDVDESRGDGRAGRSRNSRRSRADRVVEAVRGHGDSEEVEATNRQLPSVRDSEAADSAQYYRDESSTASLLPAGSSSISAPSTPTNHSLTYHIALLLVGFIALLLSAFVLSHAASTLVTQLGLSDVLFGVVILSIATTVPEKFIAVVSGSRGHAGILVANTVDSNIFLLTLCLGILWTATDGELNAGSVNPAEIGVMLGSTVWMTATIWFDARWARYIGAAMLVAYVAFIVLEFAVIRQV
ncbi:hypothetical protein LTR36_005857 [Oleoguttula mirabilis]|uniref:Sodium/calcium exchanger membrane region domain-containing protein n=1 Tax=Oleoguttula mirabilis TaxID=1507867 RepID=A0AAV9JE43_9PEZI|nr:hypothetical protein LTR36_005857 [Oleoguttula mirabilis]